MFLLFAFPTFYFAQFSRFSNEIEVAVSLGQGVGRAGGLAQMVGNVAAFTVNFIKKI